MNDELTPQIQQRLFQLTNQLDTIQGQLDQLAISTRANSDEVAALTSGLSDPMAGESTRAKLAQLTAHLIDNEEQLGALNGLFSQTVAQEKEILQQLNQLATEQGKLSEQQLLLNEHYNQLEPALNAAVQSEQLAEVTQTLASQSQIDEVLSTIKKLNRTQFKTNAITESKEGQVASAISTLQGVVTRREEAQAEHGTQTQQRIVEARDTARGELAAAFLPALDGLELAMSKGAELTQRLDAKQADASAYGKDTIIDLLRQHKEPIDFGFWKRVRKALGGSPDADKLERNAVLDMLTGALRKADISIDPQSVTAVVSWLDGLKLVQDRFLKLFAAEGITQITADGEPFDPRLHVAVETEVRTDVKEETVVRVLQEGYKQGEKVLRYAEVVVARKPKIEEDKNDHDR